MNPQTDLPLTVPAPSTGAESERSEGPSAAPAAARVLLSRTIELPNTKRELMAVLREYRAVLFALTFNDNV
jgi:hypothetical protein